MSYLLEDGSILKVPDGVYYPHEDMVGKKIVKTIGYEQRIYNDEGEPIGFAIAPSKRGRQRHQYGATEAEAKRRDKHEKLLERLKKKYEEKQKQNK